MQLRVKMHCSMTVVSRGPAIHTSYVAVDVPPPAVSPARNIVALAMLVPAAGVNAHAALSRFAGCAVCFPSAATSAPPCAHVSRAYWSKVPFGATEPLQPSVGAAAPD